MSKFGKLISDFKTGNPGAFPEWAKEGYLSCRKLTAHRRALPDFLVIGAQKSGSTSLFNYLGLHSSVLPSVQKEIFFFNRYYACGERWYRRYFPYQCRLIERGMITGEGSTTYLCSPEAPERVHALIPNVKLIAVLREPASRALSHYHHRVRAGREKRPAAEVFSAETLQRWRDGESLPDADSVYLDRGRYAAHIRAWRNVFPADSLLVIQAEALFADTNAALSRVHQFLEIPHERLAENRVFNEGRRRGDKSEEAEILARLKAVYADMNKELKMMEGVEFDWRQNSNAHG